MHELDSLRELAREFIDRKIGYQSFQIYAIALIADLQKEQVEALAEALAVGED